MTFPVLDADFVVPCTSAAFIRSGTLDAEAYCASRHRDYASLGHEIAEAPSIGNIRDLGYCRLVSACHVEVKGYVHAFKSPFHARAYILRTFW